MSARPSLAASLHLARMGVGFIWWTALLAIVAIAAFAIVDPFTGGDSSFMVTSDVEVTRMPLNPDGRIAGVEVTGSQEPTIGEFRATLEYSPEGTIAWVLAMVLAPLALLWLFAVHEVRALLRDVASDIVFTDENARRIRRVGWILVGTALGYRPLAWWTTHAALGALGLRGEGLRPIVQTEGWLLAILTGLLVLGLGEVWRHGVEIERDRQLTV